MRVIQSKKNHLYLLQKEGQGVLYHAGGVGADESNSEQEPKRVIS